MFDCGMMDLYKILQHYLDRLYIRHRELDELVTGEEETSHFLIEEMTHLVEEMAQYKLLFLTPSVKNAFVRLSAWIVGLLNYTDNKAVSPGDSLIYCLPNIVFDIPFEVFRVMKRGNQDLYDDKSAIQAQVYNGCLQATTY